MSRLLVDNGGLQAGDQLIVVYNLLDLTVGSPNATAVGALRARGVEVTTLPQNVPVVFVHPNLEAVVRAQLGILAPTPVTQVDMYFNLVTLDASNREIDDLTGLEYALSLYNLNLAGNRIDSIDPLETLGNLQTLDVSGNEIYNIGPLVRNAGIGSGDSVQVQLNYLDLVPGGPDIQDIETLQARGAAMTYTPQKTLPSPVVYFADPNLEAAVRSSAGPADSGDTAGDRGGHADADNLDASNRGISDLGGLEHATNLAALNLDSNALTDISPIASLTNLTELDLASNPISDFSPLSSLTNLTRLIVLDTRMTDASALSGLTGLTYLHLSDNRLSSIAPLESLTGLTYLQLANNQISDIGPLAGMTGLQTLYLNKNQVADISALAGLPSLNFVALASNPLSSISPLVANADFAAGDVAGDVQHGHRPQRRVDGSGRRERTEGARGRRAPRSAAPRRPRGLRGREPRGGGARAARHPDR